MATLLTLREDTTSNGSDLGDKRNADYAQHTEPVTAACDRGDVPDEVWILSNPGVAEYVEETADRLGAIIGAYGGDASISTHDLDDEFERPPVITAGETTELVASELVPFD